MEREIDTENTGEFTFHQLLALIGNQEDAITTPTDVIAAFQVFDRDGTGQIGVEE